MGRVIAAAGCTLGGAVEMMGGTVSLHLLWRDSRFGHAGPGSDSLAVYVVCMPNNNSQQHTYHGAARQHALHRMMVYTLLNVLGAMFWGQSSLWWLIVALYRNACVRLVCCISVKPAVSLSEVLATCLCVSCHSTFLYTSFHAALFPEACMHFATAASRGSFSWLHVWLFWRQRLRL